MTTVTRSHMLCIGLGLVLLSTGSGCGRAPQTTADQEVLLPAAGLVAQETSLRGHVRLLGGIPEGRGAVVDVGSNIYCGSHEKIIDPTWKVTDDGSLADAVIAVKGSARASNLPSEEILVDQVNCIYTPTVSVMQRGQSLRVRNSDETFHNVRLVKHDMGSQLRGENLANIGQPKAGDEWLKPLGQTGVYRLECDIHRWMRSWIWVHDGIHAAVTGTDGRFSIDWALADGEYEVLAWHPQFPEPISKTVQVVNGSAEVDFSFDVANAF